MLARLLWRRPRWHGRETGRPSSLRRLPMTLVVGHADDDIGFMVGDTLLSHQYFRLSGDVGPVNGEFHSLKIQILSGGVAVAFVGQFQEAYRAIRGLSAALTEDRDTDPVHWLSNRDGLDECEFLVLLNQQTKRLFRIADGNVSESKANIRDTQN
jgi:hypothetical protein